MDRVDRIRLKVLQAAAEEARGFSRLAESLSELAECAEVPRAQLEILHEYGEAAASFAKKRGQVLDALVEPHVRRMREGML